MSGLRLHGLPNLFARPGRRAASASVVWLLTLVSLFVAWLAGLSITTGNPILIAALAGPLIGAVFLSNWRLCLWGVVVGFLLINGPLQQFAPAIGKVTWGFSALSILLIALAAVQMTGMVRPDAMPRNNMAWFVLAFIVFAVLSSMLISTRTAELLAGFKRYFQTWGVFFALAVLPFVERDLRKILKFLLVVACLHLPFAIYQYLFLVKTGSLLSAGSFDVVVGVFEGGAEGGGASGVMSLFLVVFVAVITRLWLLNRINMLVYLLGLVFFAAPLAMGEAKVVVVALPLALLLAMAGQYGRVRTQLAALIAIAGILALGIHYVSLNEVNGATWVRALDKVLAYNFGSIGYDGTSMGLNRSTVLRHWWSQHGAANPEQLFFGHGLGASYFAPSSLAPGHLFFRYPFMNINLTTLSTVLWDLGVVGLVMFLGIIVMAWRRIRIGIRAAGTHWLGEVFRATEISLLTCVISLPYNNSIISFGTHGTVFALTLGICAWAGRWASQPQPAPKT
jgi:hypothetical protein